MAGAFQKSAFEFAGFQMDAVPGGGAPQPWARFARVFDDDDPKPRIEELLVERRKTKRTRRKPATEVIVPRLEVAREMLAEAAVRDREDISLLVRYVLAQLEDDDLTVLLLS